MKISKLFFCVGFLSISLFAENGINESSISKSNNVGFTNTNDVISNNKKEELLKNPEVLRLMNEVYKKGFNEGAEESKVVMKNRLEKMGKFMDELFAFHKLYLEGKLEPPKVGVVSQPVEVTQGGKVMVLQQEYLEIIEPAKFVNKPKTWKNFIFQ